MKLSDLKYLIPRIKYSRNTPKQMPISEGYFMHKSPLKGNKPKALERTPINDEFSVGAEKPNSLEGIRRTNGSHKVVL